eukprot:9470741-Pyramimonas_sp.AAC.1
MCQLGPIGVAGPAPRVGFLGALEEEWLVPSCSRPGRPPGTGTGPARPPSRPPPPRRRASPRPRRPGLVARWGGWLD